MTREDPTRTRGSGYCGNNGEHARTHVCHCFWLTALLCPRALRRRLRRHRRRL